MSRRLRFVLLLGCLAVGSVPAAPPPDLPDAPGRFWLRLDALPGVAGGRAPEGEALHFNSLAALTEYALANRPESRAIWHGIRAEAARLDAAAAARWPTLTGQFNFTRSESISSSGASVAAQHRYGPSLALGWVLYDFGARAADIDAQYYQLVATLLNANRSLQDIVAEVEAAWFAVAAARGQVDAQGEQIAALSTSLDAVDARLAAGLASRADRLRAQAALAEAQAANEAAQRDWAKAQAQLRQAAGVAQTREITLDWEAVPPPAAADALLADLLAEAEQRRPDLAALRAAALRAQSEATRARAARWPVLALSANIGRTFFLEAERKPSTSNSIGANLTIPLFEGGRLAAEARAAEQDARRFAADADARQRAIELETTQAWYDVHYAQTVRTGVAIQFDSADESARAAEARYKAGLGSLLEWLTAQADRARARQARVQADSDWLAAFSRLNHALGRIPPALSEKER